MSIDAAMAEGTAQYQDALDELRRAGFPSTFTQTGGMSAALEIQLERGMILVTDADEILPWRRSDLMGWGAGFYESEDASDGPLVYCSTEAVSVESLLATVRQCLSETQSLLRH